MRSRKWIVGIVALAALGAGAVTASAVIGGAGSSPRPEYAQVDVKMGASPAPASASARRAKAKKPKVVYLTGTAKTVDTAVTGPYVDIRLFSCPGNSRVIGGGVVPSNTNIYQQGSYVPDRSEYHVLLGYDDEAVTGGTATSFTVTSHLICLKGAK